MSIELTLLSGVAYRGQDISGPRRRGLLALLATDLRGGCDATGLIDQLWPEGPPDRPAKALQSLVSRTRTQLGAGVILSTPTGYRLSLAEEQVDAAALLVQAAAAAQAARAGDPASALAQAERGLELWDGTGTDDDPADPVATLRNDRRPAHRTLERARAMALARLGRHGAALAPLTSLLDDGASDEELLLELLRSEAAELGPAPALRRYDAYRRALRAEIGLDPGIELQALHQQLLDSDRPPIRLGVPHEPNPLLGRAADVAAVTQLLRTARVVSIIGTGGLGKTRLAVAVSRASDRQAVYLVPLAGIKSDADVAGEVASALGVTWAPAGRHADGTFADITSRILRTVGPSQALLVLDNCEHLTEGVAELVGALVAMSPTLQILITSRAPLGLRSEVVHHLPGLSPAAAAELFAQRARAVRPGVELHPEPLARLCGRLDGLPLAVELAAARVRTMSVAEIADELAERRFALLRDGARDTPERHHTLSAVVEWSWNLLDDAAQHAMRMLSVFPDGFTAAAASRLLGAADVLERLVDQSLLHVTDTPSGTRMRMLETVREFSIARREAFGDTGQAVAGLLGWARELGRTEHETVFAAAPADGAVERLRAEQDNLVEAHRHAVDQGDGAAVAATVAVLCGLWYVQSAYGRVAKLAERSVRVLSHHRPAAADVDVTRTAVTVCALSAVLQGPHELRSLVALRRLPPTPPSTLIRAAAMVLTATPETVHAWCESDEPMLAGVASVTASYAAEHTGDFDRADAAATRMLAAFTAVQHPWMQLHAHTRIAEIASQRADGQRAVEHYEAALRLTPEVQPRPDDGVLRLALALGLVQCGAVDDAERHLQQVARQSDRNIETLPLARALRAEILLRRGELERGLQLWREATDHWTSPLDAVYGDETVGPELMQAAAVLVHAHHGRIALVERSVTDLAAAARAALATPAQQPLGHYTDARLVGTLLLAVGRADLDGAELDHPSGARSGVRLIALALRTGHLPFLPAMTAEPNEQAAIRADRAGYDAACEEYEQLDPVMLRRAALDVLTTRQAASSARRPH